MFPRKWNILFQANADGGQGSGTSSDNKSDDKSNGATPDTFDSWLASQSADIQKVVKPLYEARLEALQNTVKATRKERDDFSAELRKISKKLEADSDEKAKLLELANSADEANKKADFFEAALEYECRNPKVAFALAVSSKLFTASGAPDWKAIRAEAPELFGKVIQKRTAGSGADGEVPQAGNMSDWIRQEARK